ncbi:MAG: DUF362 domain-containing protein [Candidatus Thorarchaeota archaeon]|nr:MAG: DUF362 domain-containing protein [Candidatus Thorarchaeota archaeon]
MSKVIFTDRSAEPHYNMLDKLEHVFQELGLDEAIQPGTRVQVKTHFGNWGNTNYIRPAYVRKLVDLVKDAGGIPFVTETCGLGYGAGGRYGGRTTAIEYLTMAAHHGFTEASMGAPLMMADGYWGTDVRTVSIEGGDFVETVHVASAVLDSDIVIMLTHAKGHGLGGLGGTLKNLGIGLVGKRSKSKMHFGGDFTINEEKCLGPECGKCMPVCPVNCISMNDKAVIDNDSCMGCSHCRSICQSVVKAKAVQVVWRANEEQAHVFVENAVGVVNSIGRDKFYYINLAIDISDKCDCWNVGAPLLVHDIGIFGSRDPVAIDQATLDAINDAVPNPNSAVAGLECGEPKFMTAHACKDKSGEIIHLAENQLAHAKKMGLGSREYELVTITKEKPERGSDWP